ncbi:MAG: Lipopolysaccharide core heptosyltransferase RfaQ [Chlamydiia bacterium]|nr:Lipopolysaccharide core heptosyltransferase RfaQ [Chlamydiia bacterium]
MTKIKNLLIYALYALTRKAKRNVQSGAPRILIVSTTGLGDTIWATPAIASIRKSFPDCHLGVLTSSLGKAVLDRNPHIDKIFTIKHNCLLQIPRVLKALKKEKFDTALIFHVSQRPTLPLVHLAGPSKIIGTEGINKGLDFLLTHKLKSDYVHEIERRLNIAKEAGVETSHETLELYTSKEDRESVDSFLKKAKGSGPLIGIHPGAKDGFKMWPKENFIFLAKKLEHDLGAKVLITGDKSEKSLAEDIAKELRSAESVAGKFSLKETAALLEKLDLYIANDTGPMHMGFAMGANVLALFGPTDPNLCGPYKAKAAHIMKKPKSCMPCLNKKCREPFCMMQISKETVFNEASQILKNVVGI